MSLPIVKTNVRLVKNKEGKWCYPATQRGDGTWRKPIPVRDTYNPPELQGKYVCKGRREADAAAALANLAIKEEEILEEDTTDFRMDRSQKDGNAKETPSTTKKSGARPSTMPRMDMFWAHRVPELPESQAPSASVATSSANAGDEFDGPRKVDKTSADNSWNSPTSQDVASVPVVDFKEKCLSWQNVDNVCEKLNELKVSDKKAEEEKQALIAALDESSLSELLDEERKADMEDFKKLVIADKLSPPDYVNSWNYLVTKWIHIHQMMLGDGVAVASKEDIVKMAKSNKLMM